MSRKTPKGKSLAEVRPDLAKEWHPTKNGDLAPFFIRGGSAKKVWWKCDKGYDHEYEARISDRNYHNSGCPVCTNRKIVKSNCLLTTHPDLVKEWLHAKNGNLNPDNLGAGSTLKVWWKCNKADDHIWEAQIIRRTFDGSNCPICAGKKAVKSNCLETTHPQIANEWHPTKNGLITPKNITSGSSKKIWWKCDKGDDHEWQSSINHRSKGIGCPVCSGRKVVLSNCLANTHPELAKQWHPTKNGDLTPFDVKIGSSKTVWWKCSIVNDHIWRASIISRTIKVDSNSFRECIYCSNNKVSKSNCLETTHPEIASQWHPTKNGDLTASDVVAGSGKVIWFKCAKANDHEWSSRLQDRKKGHGCPMCDGKVAVKSNCLSTIYPKIANEWHPTKNGDLSPNDVLPFSLKKVWWKCNMGSDHEWKTAISSRSRGTNCPYCDLTPQSKQELTITFEVMQIFKDINPRGFKTRVDGKLWSIDIYIPQLNLGIEFDGSYWHKDKRALDKLKTEQLENEGFEIFRIRQEPLKRIFEDDIMSKKPFNAKQVTNDVLNQIMKKYTLDKKKIAKIDSYLAMKELQNEKALDKYINMILTKKADNK